MNNPFEKLKKLKIKPKKAAKPPEPSKKSEQRSEPDEDAVFAAAMGGVKPIAGGGRDVAPDAPPRPPLQQPEDDGATTMEKILDGRIDFDLEFSDEYMHGQVKGLDSKIFRRLKAGQFAVEAHLDMHGMTLEQAYDALLFFLREAYFSGRRVVLLIPGRGKGSPQGLSLLKREIQHWLTREPLKRVVLAYCTALPRHGGAGALYVMLRKQRKDMGKVAFDRGAFWSEDQF
ncbi:Smr protein/MutS2 [Alkalidesulfovibrio alkalitolerans DSM 16529]|uniref:Smr protein/MutS2 n=1 Tax=Alkalidesulfovibrio alkalitolerans DSM 16529 TaxID=1121439 RepID=S7TDQ3_9BACT|nr:Smr/MutS family protein [Alkalidesulfovibrio alkalitolerans]EPR34796.1 Smr protein/MutS2 [Alkalidesulfovibrio alkalitolerans DSM 16529]